MTFHHTTFPMTAWSRAGWLYLSKFPSELLDLDSPEELLNRQEEE